MKIEDSRCSAGAWRWTNGRPTEMERKDRDAMQAKWDKALLQGIKTHCQTVAQKA